MLVQLIIIITCIVIIFKLVIIFILAFNCRAKGQIWTSKLQWISWFAGVSAELINRAKRSRLILEVSNI